MGEGESMLDVMGLTSRYETRHGAVHAVNEVSFDVVEGEIVGIVGESGCGKSATIRSLLGLLVPPGRVVGGQVLFEGQDLLALPRRELRKVRGNSIGFVAQNPFGSLNPILAIKHQFHNVITAHRGRTRSAESRRMAEEMLSAVGIPGPGRVLDGYAHELSGGMAQRVVIALALILNPRLVVADEPTTALDVTIQRQILDMMRDLVLGQGRSMLLVTHDLGVVAQYCDRVVVMYAGKVVERGAVRDVFSAPAHPYTRALLESVPRRGRPLRVLAGRVADLVNYPVGCPFADRCDFVMPQCLEDPPALEPVFEGRGLSRSAACHRPEEEVADHVARAS